MRLLRFLQICQVGLVLAVLGGCTKPPAGNKFVSPVPTGAVVVQNEGYVCFDEFEDSLEVSGYFIPKGCFSSSCTRPVQQFVDIQVDTTQFVIRLSTRFVLVNPYAVQGMPRGSYGCTADCGGAGSIRFEIGDVERGIYSVWLGERNLGQISFPPVVITGQDRCFGDRW